MKRPLSPIAVTLALVTLAAATAEAQVGRDCSVFNQCNRGFSCQPFIQKCYNTPRQEGQPCSAGFSCGSGLRCEAVRQTCIKANRAPNEVEQAGAFIEKTAQQAASGVQQAAEATLRASASVERSVANAASSVVAGQAPSAGASTTEGTLVWTTCATEGGTCVLPGPRRVRYGAPGMYAGRIVQSSIACTNEAFLGDPMPGVVKSCSYWANDPEMSSGTSVATVTNVAQGKPATQSSTDFDGAASRAVDGNTNGAFFSGSVTHTATAPNQWWMVDLGANYRIESITVYNRADCCAERLNATLAVTATPGWPNNTMSYQASVGGGPVSQFRVVDAGVVTGRYVYVLQRGSEPLSLTEVVVMGVPQP